MVAETVGALLLKSGIEGAAKLATNYTEKRLLGDGAEGKRVRDHIGPHIEETFRRCSVIKTLLNPQTLANFLSIYATQRFLAGGKHLDQYGMVEHVKNQGRGLIITATGGAGKSMFTRYLWLSLFTQGDGRIPLFIELRDLNSFTTPEISSYIYHSITGGRATMSQPQFQARLSKGDFILILDGFDEVAREKQDATQKSILRLVEQYADVRVIVTSRPDGRFSSWASFEVAHVAPLLKKDVIELIDKAEFDDAPKRRFKKRVKDGDLFEKHTSFLANPLLASMMLLTFSHNFDIPEKMHLFYGQAFEALFNRHDSHKLGGYTRAFRSGLSEDDFKRLFSYFCLLTYYDQKFSFTSELLSQYITKAASIENTKVKPADFIEDLTKCVCMIVPEGLNFIFSHRSFQEFFSAYCLAYVTSNKFAAIVDRFSKRPNDETIKLLAAMHPDAFRKHYVIPLADKYSDALQLTRRVKSVPKYLEDTGQMFAFHVTEDISTQRLEYNISLDGESECDNFANVVRKLAEPDMLSQMSNPQDRSARDHAAVIKLYAYLGLDERASLSVEGKKGSFLFTSPARRIARPPKASKSGPKLEVTGDKEADTLFKDSYMYEYMADRMKLAAAYVHSARSQEAAATDAMEDLFI